MSDKPGGVDQGPGRLSLKRWSQRKLEAARTQAPAQAQTSPGPIAPGTTPPTPSGPPPPTRSPDGATQPAAAPLPPIESLTIDSEYAPFFKPHVAEATKRAALKQLFRDPRFNIMDGLDVYIGDYTQPDPIPPEMMKQLAHVRHIFDPPRTEVNAQGHVVDGVAAVGPAPVADAGGARAPTAAASAKLPARAPDATAGPNAGNADRTGGETKS